MNPAVIEVLHCSFSPLLFLYKLSAVKPQMKDHADEKPSF